MNKLVILCAAGMLLGFSVPSFAADDATVELYAVSQLTAVSTNSVQTMSDQQLNAVEGMSYRRHHDCGCGNSSQSVRITQSNWMDQANLNVGGHRGGGYVDQVNEARQSNYVLVR
jgi:hypothetical protein